MEKFIQNCHLYRLLKPKLCHLTPLRRMEEPTYISDCAYVKALVNNNSDLSFIVAFCYSWSRASPNTNFCQCVTITDVNGNMRLEMY